MGVIHPFRGQSLTTEYQAPSGGHVMVDSPIIQMGDNNYIDFTLKIDKLDKTAGTATLYYWLFESNDGTAWLEGSGGNTTSATVVHYGASVRSAFVRFRIILRLTGAGAGDRAFAAFDLAANVLRSS